ncbi:MAG TPA: preprotein translocase subunit SecG [Balneolaceae bacterium]|nr:preprotein translocase subunit SecG [Balneolaceae bacterium]|tara:strand:- start:27947 stop:28327 length:381 start_codon:yes stop_codon:yes gene_type:complete
MLYTIIIVLITIICALLTLVILLQNGQGEGLSGMGGGAAMGGSAGLGARRTADILSKSTSILGGAFLVLCVLANFFISRPQQSNSVLQQGAPVNNIDVPSQTPTAVPTTPAPTTNDAGSDNGDSEN